MSWKCWKNYAFSFFWSGSYMYAINFKALYECVTEDNATSEPELVSGFPDSTEAVMLPGQVCIT